MFREWKIPATIYLITDFLDGKLWPWWNQVEYAVMHTTLASVTLALIPAGSTQTLHLGSRDQKEQAVSTICAQVVKVPNQTRLDFLRTLPDLFQVELPVHAPVEYSPAHLGRSSGSGSSRNRVRGPYHDSSHSSQPGGS